MAIKCPYCEYEGDYPFSVHSVHCDECGKKFYLGGSEGQHPIKEEDKGDFLVECLVVAAIVIMLFSCKVNGFGG